MKTLTLQQKNDMIDWMVEKSEAEPSFKMGDLLDYWFGYVLSMEQEDKIFNAIFPEMGYHNGFDTQSERILYLLLVKEFINQ